MIYRIRIHIIILLSAVSFSAWTQIEQGGTPLMNDGDFNPSSVIYLLEPYGEEMTAALKSSSEASVKKALHFADERPIDLSPEVNGQWVVRNGKNIWRAHIISPGAHSIGVNFSSYVLNDNARIFLYDPEGNHIKGSYTSRNNKENEEFIVGHIPGEEVIIELQVQGMERDYGALHIGSVSHAFLPVFTKKSPSLSGLGESQDCEIDINCAEGDDWQILKRSICHIYTGSLFCTGVLVNNTLYNGKPYILTAEHCINTAFRAGRSVFYFNYENSSCGSLDGEKDKSVSGATLMATGDSLDFTLIRMSERPPREYNVYFSGWDIRPQEHLGSVSLHHPNADAKKISIDFQATVTATSVPGDLNDYILESNYWIKKWDVGTTEGGSSGCPLFNSSKKLIGNLSGGLAVCGDSVGYDAAKDRVIYSLNGNENDFYSKLYFNWDHYPESSRQLKHWLSPGSTQTTIGGLNATTLDVDLSLASGSDPLFYPNPAAGILRIDQSAIEGRLSSVEFLDMTGRTLMIRDLNDMKDLQINVETLPPGVYLGVIHSGSKKYTERILIR